MLNLTKYLFQSSISLIVSLEMLRSVLKYQLIHTIKNNVMPCFLWLKDTLFLHAFNVNINHFKLIILSITSNFLSMHSYYLCFFCITHSLSIDLSIPLKLKLTIIFRIAITMNIYTTIGIDLTISIFTITNTPIATLAIHALFL